MQRLALTSQHQMRWIATSIILTNTLCAAFAMSALGDVQYSSTASVPVPQQTLPTPAPRLEFRIQKGGTTPQLHQAQLRRLELVAKPGEVQRVRTAIAQLDQHIATLYEPAVLNGTDIARAWVNPRTLSEITIQFTATGSQKFAQLTQRIAGTERTLGFFIDGRLLVAPTVPQTYATTGITGGKVQIMGNFTPQQASELVKQLENL